jgi:hypothetical protein
MAPIDFTVLETVTRLAQSVAREERAAARDAADEELAQGLAAAERLHDQADETRMGAFVSGGITIGSAGYEMYCASSLQTPTGVEATDKIIAANNQKVMTNIDVAKGLGQLSGSAKALFDAEATSSAAEAQADEARAKAAGRRVDDAEAGVRAALQTDGAAKDALRDMQATDHQAVMAILARQ